MKIIQKVKKYQKKKAKKAVKDDTDTAIIRIYLGT